LIGGAVLLWRQQRIASACGPDGACTPPGVRVVLLIGLLLGAILLWLGYSYVGGLVHSPIDAHLSAVRGGKDRDNADE
ncbi:hypothetical protein ABTK14_24445, partial [Acinetobacter baumannii]